MSDKNLPAVVSSDASLPALADIGHVPDVYRKADREGQVRALAKDVNRAIFLSFALIVLFFFGLGGWAAFAPLGGAVVSMGEVKIEGREKTVQHLDGGIVREILVRDGDVVKAGQALLRLDRTVSNAQVEMTRDRLSAALVLEARLLAERDGAAGVSLPAELRGASRDPKVAEILVSQQRLFETRRVNLDNQEAILRKRIQQSGEEIRGLEAQRDSMANQLVLVREEAGTVERLMAEGLAIKSRLLALQRTISQLEGQRGELTARIARIRQAINETELQILSARQQFARQVAEELRNTQDTIRDLRERMPVVESGLERTEVTAPVAGKVVDLQVFTLGAVVRGGQELMKIVPTEQNLIVETYFKPTEVDELKMGMAAEVKFTAFNPRYYNEKIMGKLVFLSPSKVEERDPVKMKLFPMGFYIGRVEVDLSASKQITRDKLFPGLPATVIVPTRERTALQYMLEPLLQGLETAFKD